MKIISITLCLLGILYAFLPSDFFSKSTFSKSSFRNIFRVSNSLDPDHTRQNVGPDLGPNCLQRLSADFQNQLFRKIISGIDSGYPTISSTPLLYECKQ